MSGRHHRSVSDLQDDRTCPRGLKGYEDDETIWMRGRRKSAIDEVLCRLSPEHYGAWKNCVDRLAWFVPCEGLWGQVDVFPSKTIIYLSPLVEFVDASDAAVVGLVAHEMAHAVLTHGGADLAYEEKERAADQLARSWGFSAELDAMGQLLRFFQK
jgi:hypothetical protein